jgi:5-methyltetrahydrofolate--homocysteine methyltransferase
MVLAAPRRRSDAELFDAMLDFLNTLAERVVINDGALDTNIQVRQLTLDDFWGKEGCNELLVLSRRERFWRREQCSHDLFDCFVGRPDAFAASPT